MRIKENRNTTVRMQDEKEGLRWWTGSMDEKGDENEKERGGM